MDYFDEIDQYLTGALNEEEKKAFEARLEEDEAFCIAFERQRRMEEFLSIVSRKKHLEQVAEEYQSDKHKTGRFKF